MNPTEDWLPTWSPDGKHIAFWSTRTGVWELFVMLADGTEQQQVSNERGRVNDWISRAPWSPDGKSLAIATQPDRGNLEIFVIDWKSGDTKRLTSTPAEDSDPDWSR